VSQAGRAESAALRMLIMCVAGKHVVGRSTRECKVLAWQGCRPAHTNPTRLGAPAQLQHGWRAHNLPAWQGRGGRRAPRRSGARTARRSARRGFAAGAARAGRAARAGAAARGRPFAARGRAGEGRASARMPVCPPHMHAAGCGSHAAAAPAARAHEKSACTGRADPASPALHLQALGTSGGIGPQNIL